MLEPIRANPIAETQDTFIRPTSSQVLEFVPCVRLLDGAHRTYRQRLRFLSFQ
jgi:hypothetical protein